MLVTISMYNRSDAFLFGLIPVRFLFGPVPVWIFSCSVLFVLGLIWFPFRSVLSFLFFFLFLSGYFLFLIGSVLFIFGFVLIRYCSWGSILFLWDYVPLFCSVTVSLVLLGLFSNWSWYTHVSFALGVCSFTVVSFVHCSL
jgi:hypothetical protein